MKKKCFIVSPIGEEGSPVRRNADYLFKFILKPVCEAHDFECIRADQIQKSDIITSTVIDHLKDSDLVIADMTGHNPNVFYEMGFRYAFGRPIIQMKDKTSSIPFDLGSIRTIDYDIQDLEDVEKVKESLGKFIDNSIETIDETDINQQQASLETVIIERLNKIQDQIAAMNNSISKYLQTSPYSLTLNSISNNFKEKQIKDHDRYYYDAKRNKMILMENEDIKKNEELPEL
jgi:uncharacterized protein YqgV (UPF0045/DUF77 family)